MVVLLPGLEGLDEASPLGGHQPEGLSLGQQGSDLQGPSRSLDVRAHLRKPVMIFRRWSGGLLDNPVAETLLGSAHSQRGSLSLSRPHSKYSSLECP